MFKIEVEQIERQSPVVCKVSELRTGIQFVVDGYYVFTLLNSGVLLLHRGVRSEHIKSDKQGYIEIERG